MTISQQDAVLTLLQEPLTIEEMVEITGANYHSLWRTVKGLVDEGRVVAQPFKRDRKNIYVAATGIKPGKLMLHRPGLKPEPMSYYLGEPPNPLLNGIVGFLSYVWRFSYHLPVVIDGTVREDVTKYPGWFEPVELRAAVLRYREDLRHVLSITDQVLDCPELWKSGEAVRDLYERMGDLPVGKSVAEILAKAEEFEKKVKGSS